MFYDFFFEKILSAAHWFQHFFLIGKFFIEGDVFLWGELYFFLGWWWQLLLTFYHCWQDSWFYLLFFSLYFRFLSSDDRQRLYLFNLSNFANSFFHFVQGIFLDKINESFLKRIGFPFHHNFIKLAHSLVDLIWCICAISYFWKNTFLLFAQFIDKLRKLNFRGRDLKFIPFLTSSILEDKTDFIKCFDLGLLEDGPNISSNFFGNLLEGFLLILVKYIDSFIDMPKGNDNRQSIEFNQLKSPFHILSARRHGIDVVDKCHQIIGVLVKWRLILIDSLGDGFVDVVMVFWLLFHWSYYFIKWSQSKYMNFCYDIFK